MVFSYLTHIRINPYCGLHAKQILGTLVGYNPNHAKTIAVLQPYG